MPCCTSDGNTLEPADQLTMDDTPRLRVTAHSTVRLWYAMHDAGPGDTGGRDMVLTRDLSIVDDLSPT